MSDEIKENEQVFLSYLDEKNIQRDGYVELVKFDSSMIRFKTKGNLVILPTSRILKLKQKLSDDRGWN